MEKGKKNRLLLVILIIILCLASYIVYDKIISKKEYSNTTITKISDDMEKITGNRTFINTSKVYETDAKEILLLYENAYDEYFKYNNIFIDHGQRNLLGKYFTEKCRSYIETSYLNNYDVFFDGIFGFTDQDIRPLKIISIFDNTALVTGQLTMESNPYCNCDKDEYPLYIIFKKTKGTWLIDMFE